MLLMLVRFSNQIVFFWRTMIAILKDDVAIVLEESFVEIDGKKFLVFPYHAAAIMKLVLKVQ